MSISIFSITENFITKFTLVFILIHDKSVNLEKEKTSKTHLHVFSIAVKFKMMVILTFKIESEKELGKSIVDIGWFIGCYYASKN